MFDDRKDAGQKLALALDKYKDKGVVVLGIPRGGVEVGYYVAKHLNADFGIIVSRKLPTPDNPEAGFGAVAEDGSLFIFKDVFSYLSKDEIEAIIEEQKAEIKRRIDVLRQGKPLPEITGKTVIIVDDGIAMGSTMRASIELCKHKKAKRIVVASPVSGRETEEEFKHLVDDVIILEKPPFFTAVAQVYRNWSDVPNTEVLEIMKKWERERLMKEPH